MRKPLLGFSAVVLALSLNACGATDQRDNNVVADDLNAMTSPEEPPRVAPGANITVENSVAEAGLPKAPAPKPTTAKPTRSKSKPTPAKPEPAPATEANAQEPTCAPEHRALGHC